MLVQTPAVSDGRSSAVVHLLRGLGRTGLDGQQGNLRAQGRLPPFAFLEDFRFFYQRLQIPEPAVALQALPAPTDGRPVVDRAGVQDLAFLVGAVRAAHQVFTPQDVGCPTILFR